jgi:hypothetical protein
MTVRHSPPWLVESTAELEQGALRDCQAPSQMFLGRAWTFDHFGLLSPGQPY